MSHIQWSSIRPMALALAAAMTLSLLASPTQASKVGWIDDVVQQVVKDSDAAKKLPEGAKLLRGSDETLQTVARRHDDLARSFRAAGAADAVDDAVLNRRFMTVMGDSGTDMADTFRRLAPAEKRAVVEMAETTKRLCAKYPDQAVEMIQKLGPEGLSCVRVFGDDVAQVALREGPQSLNILRKTGRNGWNFAAKHVWPNKGKLAAAGVLGLFLASPEKFVDELGNITQFAAEQFALAGLSLAATMPEAVGKGIAAGVSALLAQYGLDYAPVRWGLTAVLCLFAAGCVLMILGKPFKTVLWPVFWLLRRKPKTVRA